ncbi:Rrf2 family transcriptional regulator, partial [Streptococcus suis]|nr:Rrf2 family transcriptional regulator [Streptococcus suis]
EILSSQALAESVGTNASYIRKVIALFQNQMDSKIEKYENLVINLETLIKMISGRHNCIDKKENTKSI